MSRKGILLFLVLTVIILNSCENLIDPTNSKEIAAGIEGSWKCDETLKSPDEVYYTYITLNENDSTKVIISNFNGLGDKYEVTATVNGYSITIPNQTLIDGYSARGSGTISSDLSEINWVYFVDDGSGTEEEFDAIYTSQY